jgi:hypothetical protein
MRQTENKKQNDRHKSSYSSNNSKCEWIKKSSQKIDIVGLDKVDDPTICYLNPRGLL